MLLRSAEKIDLDEETFRPSTSTFARLKAILLLRIESRFSLVNSLPLLGTCISGVRNGRSFLEPFLRPRATWKSALLYDIVFWFLICVNNPFIVCHCFRCCHSSPNIKTGADYDDDDGSSVVLAEVMTTTTMV